MSSPVPKKGEREPRPTLKQIAFLAAYAELGIITAACKIAGCSPDSVSRWKWEPEFAVSFAGAHEQACDALEAEARRRAVEGTDEPVFYKGAECGNIRKYSDNLLMFILKGARPEKYAERQKVEVSEGVLSDAELERIASGQQPPAELVPSGSGGGTAETEAVEE